MIRTRALRMRGARALFTTRHGGVSVGSFSSANLARHVGDDDAAVERNRAALAAQVGAPLVFVDQVHSADVHVLPATGECPVVTADALVTGRDDVALAIMVADCMPVLMVDAEAGVVAAAHAGRRGLLDGILQATVAAMATLGARPARIRAVVGPSACGSCYEVPEPMREESMETLSAVGSTTSWGTPALDLRAGAVQALVGAGLRASAIDAAPACTLEDEDFFSYRRDPGTGRFAGVIRRDDAVR